LPSLQKSLALLAVAAVAAAINLRDIGVNSGNQGSQCCSPACGDGCHDFDARTVTAQYWCCYGRLPPQVCLPLISYGGSMIASLLVAGLLIRVARESTEAEMSIQERRSAAGGSGGNKGTFMPTQCPSLLRRGAPHSTAPERLPHIPVATGVGG